MTKIFNILCLSLITWSGSGLAQQAYVLSDNTPVIFSDKEQVLVFEAASADQNINEIRAQASDFKPASEFRISPTATYWIRQKLVNHSQHDKVLRISSSGWSYLQSHVVRPDTVNQLKASGTNSPYNILASVNPYTTSASLDLSQYAVFQIKSGEEIEIYSKVKSHSSTPARSFSLSFYDHAAYLELRRLGVYFEGTMLGVLFALAVFGWYSYAQNRDKTSLSYGIWLSVGVLQCLLLPIHDGQRMTEFFWFLENQMIGWQNLGQALYSAVSYAQTVLYVIFARNFLDVKRHFPVFYKISNVWIVWEVIHLTALLTQQHELNQQVFWLPVLIPIVLILLSIYVCAFIRWRQGLTVAQFFMMAMLPYLFFRVSFMLGIAGFPSPFSFLPQEGFSLFFQNTNTNQAFGVCCEALIMALAVISRTRWLQTELATNIQKQKDLLDNQNKLLEHTVLERTNELREQHKELDLAHQLVVSSVNYASRLQRGQLPRPIRLEGRFKSFASLWEPRDTIGGDLYWVSSSQHPEPFVLAVADCTGHGVPGAMLSLLVSNSLERIYANDTLEDPASALKSLDHFVRTGLNQDRADAESDDGCDAAILKIDRRLQRIEYAGAKIDLFHVSDHVVHRYGAKRISLGYKDGLQQHQMPQAQLIHYKSGDVFAIVTDGLTDQVGGAESARAPVSFGYRRLERILLDNCEQTAEEIVNTIKQGFDNWQGLHQRRDDVTAIVFKL